MTADRHPRPGLDRRTFLKLSGSALGVLMSGQGSLALGAEPDWTEVGSEADFPFDKPVFLKKQLAFVVRREAGWHGLSARCTHRGCTVAWSGKEFVCPCHQARFDISGAVVAEPAREPLPVLAVKVENGRVWLGP